LAAPQDIDFDDAGRPVPAVDFVYPDDSEAEVSSKFTENAAAITKIRQEAISDFVARIALWGNARQIGQRFLALAFISGSTPYQNRKELAKAMKVTPQRASQILSSLKRQIARKNRENPTPRKTKAFAVNTLVETSL